VPVNKHETLPSSNLIPSATASGSCQLSCDQYHLSSDDEEYLTPNNGAETTPTRSYRAAHVLTAARLYFNLPPEAPNHWGQINQNLDNLHSDPMENNIIFWSPDITDWWRQSVEMHSKYADLSNVACEEFFIIPRGVGVEASVSLDQPVIGCRQSNTTRETLHKKSRCKAVCFSQ